MNRPIALGLAMLTGAVFGAAAVSGLNAQGKAPGAYVVIDISTISDPAACIQPIDEAAFHGLFIRGFPSLPAAL